MARNTNTLTGKTCKHRTSTSSKSPRKNRRRRKGGFGNIKFSKMLPALIIEALAVIAILVLFFGMKADLNREARLELPHDTAITTQQEVATPVFGMKNVSRLSIYMAN